jgi:class 3 adenylate cyclase
MEPRIQYARTVDGVRIAFATYGEGAPIVWAAQPLASHVQLEWQQPMLRATYSRLVAQGRMLVRFDPRGVGLSDREVDDLSLDAWLLDMEAVVDHLGLKTFALLGLEVGGLTAMGYAVRHPERVTHLVLLNCVARGADVLATPRGRAFMGLVDDFEMWSENVGSMVFGFGREEARNYGEFIRACVDPEILRRLNEQRVATDMTGLLSQITTPTLVVRHTGLESLPMDATRELASGIPNARLLVIEGFYPDNTEQLFSGVDEFLGEGEEAAAGGEPTVPGGMVTILFTDMEGSTALTQRLGDAKAQEVLRTHNAIVRDALKAHSGSEIKHTGDGIMASFGSASKALECAIAMQRAFAEQNESAEEPIRVRIGLNAGEPIAEDADLFGTAVQLAARICAQAEPGQILAPIVVRELAAGKRFLFADRGEVALRGFEDPVRLYEVRWREEGG